MAELHGDKNGVTPSPQNFAGRLRSQAAFLASNYNDLSDSEVQVIVRAMESAADHVEAYLGSTLSHVAPNCPYRSYKDHDPANCGHCSSPSTTARIPDEERMQADVIANNAPHLRERLPEKYHHFFDCLVSQASRSAIVAFPAEPTGAMLALIAGEDCEPCFRTRTEARTVYYALRGLCRTDGGKQT